MNLNSFPTQQQIGTDEYHRDPNFPPDYHSSSSVSCHDFFSSSRDYYNHPHHHFFHQTDEFSNHGGSSRNKIENDLRLSLWGNKEDQTMSEKAPNMSVSSSKKIKNSTDCIALKITTTPLTINQKPSSFETDQFSSSNNSSPHSPIRVCSDCNTTKTPLWRSGPKGPKSLCNACGIRQRKARRAMAAAAAAAAVGINQTTNPKLQQHKAEKTARKGQSSLQVVRKRCKTMMNSSDGGSISPPPGNRENKKVCFEDMLINLSKKLAVVHRVFPEEEKDAAILLMALSYGLVHG